MGLASFAHVRGTGRSSSTRAHPRSLYMYSLRTRTEQVGTVSVHGWLHADEAKASSPPGDVAERQPISPHRFTMYRELPDARGLDECRSCCLRFR